MSKVLRPIHPGETIREDILKPLHMSVNQLAKALKVDAARLNEIVRGRRGITADTALRLASYSRNERRILDWPTGRLRVARGSPIEAEAD